MNNNLTFEPVITAKGIEYVADGYRIVPRAGSLFKYTLHAPNSASYAYAELLYAIRAAQSHTDKAVTV